MTERTIKNICGFSMNRLHLGRFFTLFMAVSILFSVTTMNASAAGTPAGSIISNYAKITYTMAGNSLTQNSNINTLMVDDKVTFNLTAADAANVTITPGGKAYMTYILTNTGNATHDFTLNTTITGTPTLTPATAPVFYADAVGTTPLPTDPNAGTLPYLSNLAPDSARTVYLFISAPPQTTDGQTIAYLITAEAYQPANLGVIVPPVKSSTQAAIDTPANKNSNLMARYVVLAEGHGNGGDADRDGKYTLIAKDGNSNTISFKVHSAAVDIVKSQTVSDRVGGSQPMSGATIHYSLAVSATGTGTALGVMISDPIPANTTYTTGTLRLNGSLLSDAADIDAGDVGATTAGTVTIRLGDMTTASRVQVISFDVKIN